MEPHGDPSAAGADRGVSLLPSWYVVKLTATASLGGCLFGYDMGAISGTLPQLTATFGLDNNQKELVVSILYVGGALGACIGGSLCDRIGRKVTIILTDFLFTLGAVWLYFAPTYAAVVAGRFVVGVGVAVSGVADVTYLRECAPIEWRGSIVSVNEACISLGFLLAYCAGYVYADEGAEEWRTVFGVAGILAVIQFLGMLKLPESPAWLTEKGHDEAARQALELINGSTDDSYVSGDESGVETLPSFGRSSGNPDGTFWSSPTRNGSGMNRRSSSFERRRMERVDSNCPLRVDDAELDGSIQPATATMKNMEDEKISNRKKEEYASTRLKNRSLSACSCVRKFGYNLQAAALTLSRYRQQTYIALFLAVAQQFCGQTSILNYAPLIFAEATKQDVENDGDANDGSTDQDMSLVIIGLVKFVVTILVIWRIEYIGRRSLLIFGNCLIALGLLALVVAFGGSNNTATSGDADGENDAASWSPMTNIKTFDLALPGVLLVVSGYSMSFGPLTWLLTSEIFPTEIRGRALGYSSIITSMCGAISTQTFLYGQSILGPSFVFGIYCVITVAGVMFAYLAIPDTGGKTIVEIEESLNQMYWWKYSSIALSQDDEGCMGRSTNRSEMVPSPSPDFSGHGLT